MTKRTERLESEISKREEYYKKAAGKLAGISIQEKTDSNIQENTITNEKEIFDVLRLYLRDKVNLTVIDKEKHRYTNNNILFLEKEKLVITNPFVTYANKIFPTSVICHYEIEGVEYSFVLKKISQKDNSKNVACILPTSIKVIKHRNNSRYSPDNKIAIGVYFKEKDKEIIGYLSDISSVGVGMSFQESSLDNEILSFVATNKKNISYLIIDDNGHYFTMPINIKFVFQNRNEKRVLLGAEFINFEGQDLKEIASFTDKVKQQHLNRITKEKTHSLILNSKMDIKL